jgi:hypothetical protein
MISVFVVWSLPQVQQVLEREEAAAQFDMACVMDTESLAMLADSERQVSTQLPSRGLEGILRSAR